MAGSPRAWEYPGLPGRSANALARNPFPILIPAIGPSNRVEGWEVFRAGVRVKRALLELEGVEFSPTGRVVTDSVYY